MPKKILIVAGEPSGDLHASRLVASLKAIVPDLEFAGIGGALMKREGVRVLFDITKLALVGYLEVVRNLATVARAWSSVMREVKTNPPDLAILVDYPGFNLRLAKALKRRSIRIVYYISPQVWAWAPERIKIIKGSVEKMIVFFPFEEDLYRTHGVNVEWVGHPLAETAQSALTRDEAVRKFGLDCAKRTIALLPGSRAMEVRHHFGLMIEAARLIAWKVPSVQFIVSRFPGMDERLYTIGGAGPPIDVKFITGDTYDMVRAADFAIVASGTAVLETAILGTPMVIVYRASLPTYVAFKIVCRLPHIGIVNIIAGREVVPEFLQYDATPEQISERVLEFLASAPALRKMRDDLCAVTVSLGAAGSVRRAAQAIAPYLR